MMTSRFERREIDRFLVLLDVAVVGIFLLATGLLLVDSYKAGFYEAAANSAAHSTMFWYMVRDVALLMVALGYFVTRHFKVALQRMTNPWL